MIRKKLSEYMAEQSDLPSEIVLDVPYIQLSGDKELVVENYRGIISYEEKSVKINTSGKIIKIEGENLLLSHITEELISVSGEIKKVEFI